MPQPQPSSAPLTNCAGKPCTLPELLGLFTDIINVAIPVLISLTVAYFIWKLVDAWVIHGGEDEKVAEGKRTALIGLIVLVVMFTVWGLVNFLRAGIFGLYAF